MVNDTFLIYWMINFFLLVICVSLNLDGNWNSINYAHKQHIKAVFIN